MMKAGDLITIKATVLRVDGDFLHAQTPNGQLIQTDISNVMSEKEVFIGVDYARPSSSRTVVQKIPKESGKKSVPAAENKAVLNAPENKGTPPPENK